MLNDYQSANEEQNKKALVEYNNLSSAYKKVFSDENGEVVISDLTRSFSSTPSYIPGGDTKDTCYYEGQKSVISHIYTLLKYKPKKP